MPDYTIAVNGSTAHVVFEWRIDNLGDSDLFYASTDDVNYQWDCHPVFTQNLYRFRPAEIGGSYGGRFEQIGASWLKHGMLALNQDLCLDGSACSADPSQQLQPNCSDVYSSGLNGDSYILGPRSHANPETGLVSGVQFPHPAVYPGGAIPGGRMVLDTALINDTADPASPTWEFYIEHLAFAADEGMDDRPNNSMYKNVPTDWEAQEPNGFQLLQSAVYNTLWPQSQEVKGLAAMWAWKTLHDPLVQIIASLDGKWLVGYRVTKRGDTAYHYEYAVMNLHSAVGAWAFEVPRGASVALSGIEFNDVNPSSGEKCTCNGLVTGIECADDERCLGLAIPDLPCRSLMARCTNNVHCWAGAPCPSGFVCDSSSMCAPENGPTCTVENAGSVCPSGYDCLAMDYCIRADDWLELETVSNIRWEPAPKQDVTDDPYMTIRPNLIDWGEMNTFRFVADSAATAATLKLDLRNGTSVLIPAVAPLGP